MIRTRFESILKALSYTDKKLQIFLDRFRKVKDLVSALNENIADIVKNSYIIYFDESISNLEIIHLYKMDDPLTKATPTWK